jgi:hypothetical protein
MKRTTLFFSGGQPVNKTAARVVSSGVHYDSPKKIVQRHWSTPPPTIAITNKGGDFKDLTGVRFGRFTVVGLYQEGLWLVRCACGDFETRRSKAVNNPNNKQDRCENCRQTVHLRRKAEYLATGKNRLASFGDD